MNGAPAPNPKYASALDCLADLHDRVERLEKLLMAKCPNCYKPAPSDYGHWQNDPTLLGPYGPTGRFTCK